MTTVRKARTPIVHPAKRLDALGRPCQPKRGRFTLVVDVVSWFSGYCPIPLRHANDIESLELHVPHEVKVHGNARIEDWSGPTEKTKVLHSFGDPSPHLAEKRRDPPPPCGNGRRVGPVGWAERRSLVLAALTARPQSAKALAVALVLPKDSVRVTLDDLRRAGLATKVSFKGWSKVT